MLTPSSTWIPTLKDIQVAAYRIEGHVIRTPVMTSSSIDSIAGRGALLQVREPPEGWGV
ncbi:MAG: hypothetical protein ACMUHU_05965 [Thermoplasmatota archaeon]